MMNERRQEAQTKEKVKQWLTLCALTELIKKLWALFSRNVDVKNIDIQKFFIILRMLVKFRQRYKNHGKTFAIRLRHNIRQSLSFSVGVLVQDTVKTGAIACIHEFLHRCWEEKQFKMHMHRTYTNILWVQRTFRLFRNLEY